MNRTRYFLLFVSLLMLYFLSPSCRHQEKKSGDEEVVINVSLSNTLGLKWVLLQEMNVRDVKNIDSADVSNAGRFTFRFRPGGPGFYLLQTRPGNWITLQVQPGEVIDIQADAKKLKDEYSVKGSPGSVLLAEYFRHTRVNLHKIDSMKLIFDKAMNSDNFPKIRAELDSAYWKVFRDQKNYVKSCISQHSRMLASVFILNQHFGPNLLLNEKEDFDDFVKLDTALMRVYSQNKHALDHHMRVSEHQRLMAEKQLAEVRLAIGKPVPDIVMNDLDGKEHKLSSLKGKTVLLMFWAAMCGKCRQDHTALQYYYKKHRDKGFEIFAVSMDDVKELWKAAVSLDKVQWTQVSDLKGKYSPMYSLFSLDTDLPYYFLIDKSGNITAKARRFSELEKLLK